MEQNQMVDEYNRPFPPKRGKYYTPGLTTGIILFIFLSKHII